MKNIALFLVCGILPFSLFGQTTWKQSSAAVTFTIKNRGANVDGHFEHVNTTLIFSPDNLLASSLKGTVDVSSIKTGNNQRDQDLQGDKYFDAASHPHLEIASISLARHENEFAGVFSVTMKGVTRQVDIPFEFTESGNTAEFKGSFVLNRRNFGIGKKNFGLSMFLADDVHVTIEVKATK